MLASIIFVLLLIITIINSFLYHKTFLHNKVILRKTIYHSKELTIHSTNNEDNINEEADNENNEYEEEVIPDDMIDLLNNQNFTIDNTTTITIDPLEKAIKDYENKLSLQVSMLENTLKAEKLNLLRMKDKISETGKNGFFIVQAQVNDFSRKKDNDQKKRVKSNKREFIEKMLPVVDLFRDAPNKVPAITEKEHTMHKTYGALLDNILSVFQKYGYKEFDADVGSKLDPSKHMVSEVQETTEFEPNVIIKTIRKGISDGEDDILRRALVIASKAPHVEEEVVVSDDTSVDGTTDSDSTSVDTTEEIEE